MSNGFAIVYGYGALSGISQITLQPKPLTSNPVKLPPTAIPLILIIWAIAILSAQILTPVILNLQPCRSPLTAVVDSKVKALSDDDLLETMYPSPEELGQYWAHLLPDFEDHWLRGYPERWCRCIPIVLWGDEGTLNSSSWMVVSWNPSRQ